MNTAKLFDSGKNQAVKLPEKYRFSESEVYINKINDVVLIYPKKSVWQLFENGLSEFTDDFMESREQPGKADKRRAL